MILQEGANALNRMKGCAGWSRTTVVTCPKDAFLITQFISFTIKHLGDSSSYHTHFGTQLQTDKMARCNGINVSIEADKIAKQKTEEIYVLCMHLHLFDVDVYEINRKENLNPCGGYRWKHLQNSLMSQLDSSTYIAMSGNGVSRSTCWFINWFKSTYEKRYWKQAKNVFKAILYTL